MKNKQIQSWGKYPKVKHRFHTFETQADLKKLIAENEKIIPRGNGRAYGDSALAKNIIDITQHDYFLGFNDKTGILHVQAGVLLADILELFVPRGWFLKIVPGTKLITIGGAIASDVHGKNHHIDGCFSQSVKEFSIMLANGEIKTCSKIKFKALFQATCGGQGLTGVILDAKIQLKKIQSPIINQVTIKTNNLKETFAAFEKLKEQNYSVAWIDCLSKGEHLGRSIVQAGDFEKKRYYGKLSYSLKTINKVPFHFPSFSLNSWSVKAFNALYYWLPKNGESKQKVDFDSFFFPLDAIDDWNKIYGKNGFVQYQFILPLENSYQGIQEILTQIAKGKSASFLAVLKLYGKANNNYLSFPMEGYSLALDFKVNDKVFKLLDELDKIVIENKGRIYLSKDARVPKHVFEQGYPMIEKFRNYRKKQGMDKVFVSAQSKRLAL